MNLAGVSMLTQEQNVKDVSFMTKVYMCHKEMNCVCPHSCFTEIISVFRRRYCLNMVFWDLIPYSLVEVST